MSAEAAWLINLTAIFLLTLTRVGALFTFIPMPAIGSNARVARAALAIGISVLILPFRNALPGPLRISSLVMWSIAETAVGLTMGLILAVLADSLGLAAQIIGLQAGYSFASTIDPTTRADSAVLVVFSQLAAGLLFLALGLDHSAVRLLLWSYEAAPPGTYRITQAGAGVVMQATGLIFSNGLRFALPLVVCLALVDIALALLGRIATQLQVLTLSFPLKMLLSLFLLALVMRTFSEALRSEAEYLVAAAMRVIRP